MKRVGVVAAVLVAGCLRGAAPLRDGELTDTEAMIAAPKADRCTKYAKSSLRQPCDDAKYLAQRYVDRLATTDAVCLEGGFGDQPGARCLCRAAVANTDPTKLLLEIREAKPESRWYRHVERQIWFENGALVDLYLAEHGY